MILKIFNIRRIFFSHINFTFFLWKLPFTLLNYYDLKYVCDIKIINFKLFLQHKYLMHFFSFSHMSDNTSRTLFRGMNIDEIKLTCLFSHILFTYQRVTGIYIFYGMPQIMITLMLKRQYLKCFMHFMHTEFRYLRNKRCFQYKYLYIFSIQKSPTYVSKGQCRYPKRPNR